MTRSRESLSPPWDDLDSLRSQVESEIAADPDDAHASWEREDPKRADWDWLGALFLSGELSRSEYQQMLAQIEDDPSA